MAQEGGADNVPVKAESQPINIIVKDQAGAEVHFKIKTSTKFDKVFQAYCDKKSLTINTVKFVFEGVRVKEDDTPAKLDMQDGDAIDVFVEQIGGAACDATNTAS